MSESLETSPEPSSQQSSAPVQPTTYPFVFSGKGGEYFRIWIVNIALTLATLGIYSAWAKVRNNRYLYGNTSVANGHFDYHADPKVILKGRIIAIVLLLIYLGLSSFLPVVGVIMALLVLIAIPWIVVRSLAFNARNSSWRNLRFHFAGKEMGAAGAYIGWPLIGVLTFGFGMPYAWFKTAQYGVNNHRMGQTPFRLSAAASDFYAIFFYMIFAGILASIAFAAVSAFSFAGIDPDAPELTATQVVGGAVFALVYIAIFNLFNALRFRTIYDDLDLGENRIQCSMSIPGYLSVAVTNTIAMLFTLGLFYPWAKVRMSKFMLESLTLRAVDLDNFVASAEEEQSAFGEEFGDAFDLGIGV